MASRNHLRKLANPLLALCFLYFGFDIAGQKGYESRIEIDSNLEETEITAIKARFGDEISDLQRLCKNQP